MESIEGKASLMDEMNLYAALMGEPPSSAEQQQAIAEVLRRKNRMGQLGILSGENAMSAVGANHSAQADAAAKQLQQARQFGIEQKGLERWRNLQGNLERRKMDLGYNADMARTAAMLQRYGDDDRAFKGEKLLTDLTVKLGKQYNQAGISSADASIGNLNSKLSKFEGEGRKPEDIPGVGFWKNVPGLTFLKSDEDQEIYANLQAVANDLMKLYSGLAVTEQEARRREIEEARHWQNSPEDMIQAWPTIVNRYNQLRSSVLGGYPKEVQQRFFDQNPMGGTVDPLNPAYGQIKNRGEVVEAPAGAASGKKRVFDMATQTWVTE